MILDEKKSGFLQALVIFFKSSFLCVQSWKQVSSTLLTREERKMIQFSWTNTAELHTFLRAALVVYLYCYSLILQRNRQAQALIMGV